MLKTKGSKVAVQDFIGALVIGKKVLDVGCVQHSAGKARDETWLHRFIAENASSVLGIDILEKDVQHLASQGYRVICADAIRVELPEKFDVIVAGELIEHLNSPGPFLANMRRHLAPDGVIVITTPNVFYALHTIESCFFSPQKRWNPEHVAWYCPFTLDNLFRREGMYLQDCVYFARSRKIRALLRLLNLPCPGLLASTILVTAKVAAP